MAKIIVDMKPNAHYKQINPPVRLRVVQAPASCEAGYLDEWPVLDENSSEAGFFV